MNGVQKPYDLLWPIVRPKNQAHHSGQVTEGLHTQGAGPGTRTGSQLLSVVTKPVSKIEGGQNAWGSKDELKIYATRLLASFPDPLQTGVRIKLPVEAISPRDQDKEMGELTGCREAVEIITRNPRKSAFVCYHF